MTLRAFLQGTVVLRFHGTTVSLSMTTVSRQVFFAFFAGGSIATARFSSLLLSGDEWPLLTTVFLLLFGLSLSLCV
jgi:hypothetical protein